MYTHPQFSYSRRRALSALREQGKAAGSSTEWWWVQPLLPAASGRVVQMARGVLVMALVAPTSFLLPLQGSLLLSPH